jgi:hypothetical protein
MRPSYESTFVIKIYIVTLPHYFFDVMGNSLKSRSICAALFVVMLFCSCLHEKQNVINGKIEGLKVRVFNFDVPDKHISLARKGNIIQRTSRTNYTENEIRSAQLNMKIEF